jgi:hypothetical protein
MFAPSLRFRIGDRPVAHRRSLSVSARIPFVTQERGDLRHDFSATAGGSPGTHMFH